MSQFICFDATYTQIRADRTKDVLKIITPKIAAQTQKPVDVIDDFLRSDNCDYSLGVGENLAIMNGRIYGLSASFTGLITLRRPINIRRGARTKVVDLIGVLLTPMRAGNTHLRGLSRLSRVMENRALQGHMRGIDDDDVLLSVLNNADGLMMAA